MALRNTTVNWEGRRSRLGHVFKQLECRGWPIKCVFYTVRQSARRSTREPQKLFNVQNVAENSEWNTKVLNVCSANNSIMVSLSPIYGIPYLGVHLAVIIPLYLLLLLHLHILTPLTRLYMFRNRPPSTINDHHISTITPAACLPACLPDRAAAAESETLSTWPRIIHNCDHHQKVDIHQWQRWWLSLG